MIYAVTFENAGGDTKILHIPFENNIKADQFKDAYNTYNSEAKVIRYKAPSYEMSQTDRQAFKNQNFNSTKLVNAKCMYETIKGNKYNITIPFLDDLTTSKSDIKSLMIYIKDFAELVSSVRKKLF